MEYSRMGPETSGEGSGDGVERERGGEREAGVEEAGVGGVVPARLSRLHRLLKGLAQLQIFAGLAGLALGALADYVASANAGLRVPFIPEAASAYFILSGLVGVCASASFRRGLVTAYAVLSLHAVFVFVPALGASSVASVMLSERRCGLLRQDGGVEILCGAAADRFTEGNPDVLSAVVTDGRLEWGLVGLGLVQLGLFAASSVLALVSVCEQCGAVDLRTIQHINKLTAYGRNKSFEADSVSSVSALVNG